MSNFLELPFGIKTLTPTPVIYWEGPYSSIAAANAAVPLGVRYPSMTVRIVPGGNTAPYMAMWGNDVSDNGLAAVQTGGGGGNVQPVSGTYAELTALAQAGSLVPGGRYLLTDYKTSWWSPADSQAHTADVGETLVLLAANANIFSRIAQSLQNPDDELIYEFAYNNLSVGFEINYPVTGRIIRRTDVRGNQINFDFVAIQFAGVPVFDPDAQCANNVIVGSFGFTGTNQQNPVAVMIPLIYPMAIAAGANENFIDSGSQNITIGAGSCGNRIGKNVGQQHGYVISPGSNNNTVADNANQGVAGIIGSGSSYNLLGNGVSRIGSGCSHNTVHDGWSADIAFNNGGSSGNEIGLKGNSGGSGIVLGGGCANNKVKAPNVDMSAGGINGMDIGSGGGHVIGGGCHDITVSNGVTNLTFGSSCYDMWIKDAGLSGTTYANGTNNVWPWSQGGASVIEKTYSELMTLIAGAGLQPGATYKVTDYQTTWVQGITGKVIVNDIEPLWVRAIDASTLEKSVISQQFPSDIIEWNAEVDTILQGSQVPGGAGSALAMIDPTALTGQYPNLASVGIGIGSASNLTWDPTIRGRVSENISPNNGDGTLEIIVSIQNDDDGADLQGLHFMVNGQDYSFVSSGSNGPTYYLNGDGVSPISAAQFPGNVNIQMWDSQQPQDLTTSLPPYTPASNGLPLEDTPTKGLIKRRVDENGNSMPWDLRAAMYESLVQADQPAGPPAAQSSMSIPYRIGELTHRRANFKLDSTALTGDYSGAGNNVFSLDSYASGSSGTGSFLQWHLNQAGKTEGDGFHTGDGSGGDTTPINAEAQLLANSVPFAILFSARNAYTVNANIEYEAPNISVWANVKFKINGVNYKVNTIYGNTQQSVNNPLLRVSDNQPINWTTLLGADPMSHIVSQNLLIQLWDTVEPDAYDLTPFSLGNDSQTYQINILDANSSMLAQLGFAYGEFNRTQPIYQQTYFNPVYPLSAQITTNMDQQGGAFNVMVNGQVTSIGEMAANETRELAGGITPNALFTIYGQAPEANSLAGLLIDDSALTGRYDWGGSLSNDQQSTVGRGDAYVLEVICDQTAETIFAKSYNDGSVNRLEPLIYIPQLADDQSQLTYTVYLSRKAQSNILRISVNGVLSAFQDNNMAARYSQGYSATTPIASGVSGNIQITLFDNDNAQPATSLSDIPDLSAAGQLPNPIQQQLADWSEGQPEIPAIYSDYEVFDDYTQCFGNYAESPFLRTLNIAPQSNGNRILGSSDKIIIRGNSSRNTITDAVLVTLDEYSVENTVTGTNADGNGASPYDGGGFTHVRNIYIGSISSRNRVFASNTSIQEQSCDNFVKEATSTNYSAVSISGQSSNNKILGTNISMGTTSNDNFFDELCNNITAGNDFNDNQVWNQHDMVYGVNCTRNIEQDQSGLSRGDNWQDHNPYRFDPAPIDILYNDLLTLIGVAGLVRGRNYRITDYRTTWVQGLTTRVRAADVEPLIVTALDAQTLDQKVKSALWPADEIYYDIEQSVIGAQSLSYPITGTTKYRIDPSALQFRDLPDLTQGGVSMQYVQSDSSPFMSWNFPDGITDLFQQTQNMLVQVIPTYANGGLDVNDQAVKVKINGEDFAMNVDGDGVAAWISQQDQSNLADRSWGGNILVQLWDLDNPEVYSLLPQTTDVPQLPLQDVPIMGRIYSRKDQYGNKAPYDIRAVLAAFVRQAVQPAGPPTAMFKADVLWEVGPLVHTTPSQYYLKFDNTALTGSFPNNVSVISVEKSNSQDGVQYFVNLAYFRSHFNSPFSSQFGLNTEIAWNGDAIANIMVASSSTTNPHTWPTNLKLKINGVNYTTAPTWPNNQQFAQLVRVSDGAPIDLLAVCSSTRSGRMDNNVLIQLWDTVEPAQYALENVGTPAVQGNEDVNFYVGLFNQADIQANLEIKASNLTQDYTGANSYTFNVGPFGDTSDGSNYLQVGSLNGNNQDVTAAVTKAAMSAQAVYELVGDFADGSLSVDAGGVTYSLANGQFISAADNTTELSTVSFTEGTVFNLWDTTQPAPQAPAPDGFDTGLAVDGAPFGYGTKNQNLALQVIDHTAEYAVAVWSDHDYDGPGFDLIVNGHTDIGNALPRITSLAAGKTHSTNVASNDLTGENIQVQVFGDTANGLVGMQLATLFGGNYDWAGGSSIGDWFDLRVYRDSDFAILLQITPGNIPDIALALQYLDAADTYSVYFGRKLNNNVVSLNFNGTQTNYSDNNIVEFEAATAPEFPLSSVIAAGLSGQNIAIAVWDAVGELNGSAPNPPSIPYLLQPGELAQPAFTPLPDWTDGVPFIPAIYGDSPIFAQDGTVLDNVIEDPRTLTAMFGSGCVGNRLTAGSDRVTMPGYAVGNTIDSATDVMINYGAENNYVSGLDQEGGANNVFIDGSSSGNKVYGSGISIGQNSNDNIVGPNAWLSKIMNGCQRNRVFGQLNLIEDGGVENYIDEQSQSVKVGLNGKQNSFINSSFVTYGQNAVRNTELNSSYVTRPDNWSGNDNSSGPALLLQIGNILNAHFHLATLNWQQVNSLVTRDMFDDGEPLDAESDAYILENTQSVSVTSTLEDGHAHTVSVNYNPYTRKFFVDPATVPANHLCWFIGQDAEAIVWSSYAELSALAANQQLEPGKKYVMSDFTSKFRYNGGITTGPVEWLVLEALNPGQFHGKAQSMQYPKDDIWYDIAAGPIISADAVQGWSNTQLEVNSDGVDAAPFAGATLMLYNATTGESVQTINPGAGDSQNAIVQVPIGFAFRLYPLGVSTGTFWVQINGTSYEVGPYDNSAISDVTQATQIGPDIAANYYGQVYLDQAQVPLYSPLPDNSAGVPEQQVAIPGMITRRVDDQLNEAQYDHRNVYFYSGGEATYTFGASSRNNTVKAIMQDINTYPLCFLGAGAIGNYLDESCFAVSTGINPAFNRIEACQVMTMGEGCQGNYYRGVSNFSVADGTVGFAQWDFMYRNLQVVRDTPSGPVDGSNNLFTFNQECVAGTEEVFVNGLLMEPGTDYTIVDVSGFTLAVTPTPTGFNGAPTRIRCNYQTPGPGVGGF